MEGVKEAEEVIIKLPIDFFKIDRKLYPERVKREEESYTKTLKQEFLLGKVVKVKPNGEVRVTLKTTIKLTYEE